MTISLRPLASVAGNPVTFTALAIGAPTPTYQWQFNGRNISGATSSSYTISSVTTNDAGNYSVIASNSAGSTNSATAVLQVFDSATATLSGWGYANNQFEFTVTGVPGYSYTTLASTNLTGWVSLYTGSSPFTFTGTSASGMPYRFYRAVH